MFFKSNKSVGDTFMTKSNRTHTNRQRALVITALAASLAATGIAQAQTAGPATGSVPGTPAGTEDTSLTWHGITLSGVVDVGLQYQPHAAPVSDYYGAGGYNLIQADSLRAVGGVTPNNLSQSFIQLAGIEPLYQGISAVFKLQTFVSAQFRQSD
jgi:hypothetical protein